MSPTSPLHFHVPPVQAGTVATITNTADGMAAVTLAHCFGMMQTRGGGRLSLFSGIFPLPGTFTRLSASAARSYCLAVMMDFAGQTTCTRSTRCVKARSCRLVRMQRRKHRVWRGKVPLEPRPFVCARPAGDTHMGP